MANTNTTPAKTMTSSWQLLPKGLLLVRQNIEPIIILTVLPLLLSQLGTLIANRSPIWGMSIYIVGLLWLVISVPPAYYFEVRACQGEPVTIIEAYRKGILRFALRIYGYGTLFTFIVLGGLILFIVPGFIFLRRYFLAGYYIVDQDLPIWKAMKLSAAQTKPVSVYVWSSLLVLLVCSIVTAAAAAIFSFIPGLSIVITSLLSLTYVFLFPLRYIEVANRATLKRSRTKTKRTNKA